MTTPTFPSDAIGEPEATPPGESQSHPTGDPTPLVTPPGIPSPADAGTIPTPGSTQRPHPTIDAAPNPGPHDPQSTTRPEFTDPPSPLATPPTPHAPNPHPLPTPPLPAGVTPAQFEAFSRDLDRLYTKLAADVAASPTPPICRQSGRCCDFRTAEHTLFATHAEILRAIAYARSAANALPTPHDPADDPDGVLCPFWGRDHHCHARGARPMGCRVYFCTPGYDGPHAEALYEQHHTELIALHETHGIPYGYLPFVAALRAALEPKRSPQH